MTALEDIWIQHLCTKLFDEKSMTIEDYLAETREKIINYPDEMIPALNIFSRVLNKCQMDQLDKDQVVAIIEFLIDQSYEHTEFPLFDVLNMIVDWNNYPLEKSLRIACYIFECNDLQAHKEKKERLDAIQTIKKLLGKENIVSVFGSHGPRLVNGLIKALDGERNPEVLLEIFQLAKQLVKTLEIKDEDSLDELFNTLCMYFPIRFTGKTESEQVLGKALDVSLREALTSSPGFGSLIGVFLIDKLQDGEDVYKDKIDLCPLLEDFLREYPFSRIAPYVQGITDGLRTTAMDPRYKGLDIKEVTSALGKLLDLLLKENKQIYDKVARHNVDNIEPFIVRPEMGLQPKAIDFLVPWTAVKGETDISHWIWTKILPLLFNNIRTTPLEEYVVETLEILSMWLDIFSFSAREALRNLHDVKDLAFQRIGNDFPNLAYSHMHIIAKAELLEKGNATSTHVESFLRPSFQNEKDNREARKSAQNFILYLTNLRFDIVCQVLKHLAYEFKNDLFVNKLACSAINGKQSFQRLKKIIFNGFDEHTSVEILSHLLDQKEKAPNDSEREVIGRLTLSWLIENIRLDDNYEFSQELRAHLVSMTEIVFNLTKDIDVSNELNKITRHWCDYPYLALVSIKFVALKKLKCPMVALREYWSRYDCHYDNCLRYYAILNKEIEVKNELKDVIELKAKAVMDDHLDPKLVTEFFEKTDLHNFKFEMLFDFETLWFNHELLHFSMPESGNGMEYRERFVNNLFHPVLTHLSGNPGEAVKYAAMFEPALRLLRLIHTFKTDKQFYYQTTTKLVMAILAQDKEKSELPRECYTLMCLLPELLKNTTNCSASNEDVIGMIDTVYHYGTHTRDNVLIGAVLTTMLGLLDCYKYDPAKQDTVGRKLFDFADRMSIGPTRSVRALAALLKRKTLPFVDKPFGQHP